jgi:hypothetical protein
VVLPHKEIKTNILKPEIVMWRRFYSACVEEVVIYWIWNMFVLFSSFFLHPIAFLSP